MSLPRYPEYKDSGVAWLGEVPGHWQMSRLGFESWVRARLGWKGLKAEEYVGEGIAFLATPNIKGLDIDFENVNYINEYRYDESPEIKLREGDVLLAKDGSTLGTVNVVRSLPKPATVNSSIAVITPNDSLGGVYLYFMFQTAYMKNTIQQIKGGMGVPHLFQEDLNKFYIPLPPMEEQQTIVTFLDCETGKIDALIAEQQRLVELLAEKRQAVISHAVTKGLNPNAPMIDSGIEWLGKVPGYWEVLSIRRIATSVQTGGTPSSEPPSQDLDEGFVWYTPGDFGSSIRLGDSSRKISQAIAESGEANIFPAGSVLVVSIGATLGKVGYVDKFSSANQQINAIIPNEIIDGYFLAYSLLVKSEVMRYLSNASTIGIMNQEKTKDIWLAVPPLAEQQAITTFLDRATAQFDTLTAEANRAISLLQERRSALISAAVTGKIDVRGRA